MNNFNKQIEFNGVKETWLCAKVNGIDYPIKKIDSESVIDQEACPIASGLDRTTGGLIGQP